MIYRLLSNPSCWQALYLHPAQQDYPPGACCCIFHRVDEVYGVVS